MKFGNQKERFFGAKVYYDIQPEKHDSYLRSYTKDFHGKLA
jgi:hypothetical protein